MVQDWTDSTCFPFLVYSRVHCVVFTRLHFERRSRGFGRHRAVHGRILSIRNERTRRQHSTNAHLKNNRSKTRNTFARSFVPWMGKDGQGLRSESCLNCVSDSKDILMPVRMRIASEMFFSSILRLSCPPSETTHQTLRQRRQKLLYPDAEMSKQNSRKIVKYFFPSEKRDTCADYCSSLTLPLSAKFSSLSPLIGLIGLVTSNQLAVTSRQLPTNN